MRLTSEPVPFFGQQLSEGAPKHLRPTGSTCCGRGRSSDRRRSAVRSVGSPPVGSRTRRRVSAGRVGCPPVGLRFELAWPDGPPTDDQREWMSWLGPEVNAVLPREESAAVEWMRGVASLRLVEVLRMGGPPVTLAGPPSSEPPSCVRVLHAPPRTDYAMPSVRTGGAPAPWAGMTASNP